MRHFKKWYFTIFLFSFFQFNQAANLPTGFIETRLATNLDPMGITFVPDGRILVTLKAGQIILLKNDVVQTTPFLSIPHIDSWNERGLYSIVLDPSFADNGFVYVYYTYKDLVSNKSNNRVSRFTANGDVASLESEKVLINFENTSEVGYHNGGGLAFGIDGKIYASVGDNVESDKAQKLDYFSGKVVRINPDGTIPTDNPFYTTLTGNHRAIYALGFRNPFKLKMHPNGKLYVHDVGFFLWEEINELQAGSNYGWPITEGKRTTEEAPANYLDPVYTYYHGAECAITGGSFYSTSSYQFPSFYQEKYFFMDYCAGWIRYIDPLKNYEMSSFASEIDRPLDMAVAKDGTIYYLARGGFRTGNDDDNTMSNNGELWKINYTGRGLVHIGAHPLNQKIVQGASVTFSVSASGTNPLRYQWKRNGQDIEGANSSLYTITSTPFTENGAKFSVEVANDSSTSLSTEATLTVIANTAPVAIIEDPSESFLYEAGTVLRFNGSGSDAEDGVLPDSAFTWTIHFHHDTHFHPAVEAIKGASGTFLIPDQGETSDHVWYRLYLTAKDSLGTSTTVSRDIFPKKSTVTLNTLPVGLPLLLDGTTVSTPYTFVGVVGIKRTIEALQVLPTEKQLYSFVKWSNGGDASQTLATPPTGLVLTASFVRAANDTLATAGDAYVSDGLGATNTYGTENETELQITKNDPPSATQWTYLLFDISGISYANKAKLRLYGNQSKTEGGAILVVVFGVKDTNWKEQTITWNNRPSLENDTLQVSRVSALPSHAEYYEWEVNDYLEKAFLRGEKHVSFALASTDTSSGYVQFHSKEKGSHPPQLILTVPLESLSNPSYERKISAVLYPNPFSSDIEVVQAGAFDYTVFDLTGNKLLEGRAENSIRLGTSFLSGLYVIKVQGSLESHYYKVVKK